MEHLVNGLTKNLFANLKLNNNMANVQGTIILQCNCKDEQQDKMYGKDQRLHNKSADGKTAYCTVCSPNNIWRHTFSDPKPSKKGKLIR